VTVGFAAVKQLPTPTSRLMLTNGHAKIRATDCNVAVFSAALATRKDDQPEICARASRTAVTIELAQARSPRLPSAGIGVSPLFHLVSSSLVPRMVAACAIGPGNTGYELETYEGHRNIVVTLWTRLSAGGTVVAPESLGGKPSGWN